MLKLLEHYAPEFSVPLAKFALVEGWLTLCGAVASPLGTKQTGWAIPKAIGKKAPQGVKGQPLLYIIRQPGNPGPAPQIGKAAAVTLSGCSTASAASADVVLV